VGNPDLGIAHSFEVEAEKDNSGPGEGVEEIKDIEGSAEGSSREEAVEKKSMVMPMAETDEFDFDEWRE